MKLQLKALSLALGAATLMAGTAWGETTAAVGSITAGSPPTLGNASTSARLNVSLIVPKIIILRIGSTGGSAATVDDVLFTVGLSGHAAGAAGSTYTGAIPPSLGVAPVGTSVSVQAWTNAASANLSCVLGTLSGYTALPTAGSLIEVTSSGGPTDLVHPGGISATLANCTGATQAIASGATAPTSLGGTFIYGANAGVTGYLAGTYGNLVTYTAVTL